MVLITSNDPDDCSDMDGIDGRRNARRDDVEVNEEEGDDVNELTPGTEGRTKAMVGRVRLSVRKQWTGLFDVASAVSRSGLLGKRFEGNPGDSALSTTKSGLFLYVRIQFGVRRRSINFALGAGMSSGGDTTRKAAHNPHLTRLFFFSRSKISHHVCFLHVLFQYWLFLNK